MKKSGFGSIFEKNSTPKMSKLKVSDLFSFVFITATPGRQYQTERQSGVLLMFWQEAHSPESGVIVKTAKDGCAEGLVYGGGGRDGIFIKGVVPESPASKSLKLKEGK